MHYALLDEPRSGAENMAIDQAMLDSAERDGICLLRVYRWTAPTVSLGYFQNYRDRLQHAPSSDLDVVRRKTGGGAIVHHHDWTYSIAVPDQLTNSRASTGAKQLGAAEPLYYAIHTAIVGWLQGLGIEAERWRSDSSTCNTKQADSGCQFLCFKRRAVGDVVANRHKLMGSAQRRQRGALLQHGSLLLKQSRHAPDLKGVAELAPKDSPTSEPNPPNSRDFFERIRAASETFLGRNLQPVSTLPSMLRLPISDAAFRDPAWTRKR